jgi:hypothetical protein
MSRLAFAFVHYKRAILEKAEVPKLRQAEQELRDVLKNLTEEDIDYLVALLKDHIYMDEALRKKSQKLYKAEEFINSIKERFETFKL